MAERVDLKSESFQHKVELRFKYKLIPIINIKINKYRKEFFWRYRWANKLSNNKNILEIPCGLGYGTNLLDKAKIIIAADIDYVSVKEALLNRGNKNQSYFVGNMSSLSFPNSYFDLICCLEGIEHISVESGKSFIKECHRVLKPNGTLLLSSPYATNRDHSGNPYHLHEYSPREMKLLLTKYFFIENVTSRPLDNLIIQYIICTKFN